MKGGLAWTEIVVNNCRGLKKWQLGPAGPRTVCARELSQAGLAEETNELHMQETCMRRGCGQTLGHAPSEFSALRSQCEISWVLLLGVEPAWPLASC